MFRRGSFTSCFLIPSTSSFSCYFPSLSVTTATVASVAAAAAAVAIAAAVATAVTGTAD